MKNQIILAGTLINNPIIQYTKNDKKFAILKIKVKRGIDTDKADIFECIAMNTDVINKCKLGDLVEIIGNLYSEISKTNNVKKFAIIATHITILN